ncbi:MAG TPA: T9SS type A sorting domain-containing protein, partial [Bacteroidales bacterium]|nr:T9SS type A sorting domain-containing protein [Bacteroidales bacterium]
RPGIAQSRFLPNPATNQLTIQLNGKAGNAAFYLLNYQGQVVYSNENVDVDGVYQQQLDLSTYAKGIYYIRLNSGNTTIVKKVVIQ